MEKREEGEKTSGKRKKGETSRFMIDGRGKSRDKRWEKKRVESRKELKHEKEESTERVRREQKM